jgi:glycosyltransferase 2 family protein
MVVLGGIIAFSISLFVFRNKMMEYRIVQKFISLLLGFWEGLQSIRNIKNPLLFISHSLLIWTMYFLMTYLCFYAFAPTSHLGLRAGLIVFIFGTFGVIIPSPGGMGTFHALAIIALAIYGISGDDAFSFANILFFTVQLGSSILLGIISLIALPMYNRGYTPDRPAIMQKNI